jgi:hypothetical protein
VGKKDRNPVQEIISGFAMTAVFVLLWSMNRSPIWVLLGVFLGVLPMLEGFSRYSAGRLQDSPGRDPAASDQDVSRKEKELLNAARRLGGVVTPAIIAVETSLSLEQAEEILQRLAGKGYTDMRVTESGRIEYIFPEFLQPG